MFWALSVPMITRHQHHTALAWFPTQVRNKCTGLHDEKGTKTRPIPAGEKPWCAIDLSSNTHFFPCSWPAFLGKFCDAKYTRFWLREKTNLVKNIIQKYNLAWQGYWFLLWFHESYFVKCHQHCSFAWCLRTSVFHFLKYFSFKCTPRQDRMQKSINRTEWQLPLAAPKLCKHCNVSSLYPTSLEGLPFLHDGAAHGSILSKCYHHKI